MTTQKVFHDTGNINFSFIRNKDSDFVDFREHIEPISEALAALGIPNLISPRNDIFVNERKVSGNAEHVNSKVKRILHHLLHLKAWRDVVERLVGAFFC